MTEAKQNFSAAYSGSTATQSGVTFNPNKVGAKLVHVFTITPPASMSGTMVLQPKDGILFDFPP